MKKLDYDEQFYKLQKKTNISSAEKIVPIVLEILEKKNDSFSVIDLGCGSGNWLSVFKKYGCAILGVDGGTPSSQLMINKEEFVSHDFRNQFKIDKTFSLAVSLECAEHIPEENTDEFVDTLVELSDIILFSAAIPYQRGRGHVNEQYQSYWMEKFEKRGYKIFDVIRSKIWNDLDVRAFYAQNIFLYVKKDSAFYRTHEAEINKVNNLEMIDIVNPRMWEDINNYKIVKMMDKMHDNPFFSMIYYKFIKKHIKFN